MFTILLYSKFFMKNDQIASILFNKAIALRLELNLIFLIIKFHLFLFNFQINFLLS